MVEFRRSLAASFLFRFFLLSSYKLAADSDTFQAAFPETYKSAVKVSAAVCLQLLVAWHVCRQSIICPLRATCTVGLQHNLCNCTVF